LSRWFKPSIILVILAVLILPACATYRKSEGLRLKLNPEMASRCPDRVNRARVGSLTGTVLGVMIGFPLIGGIYSLAGYAMGFASGSSCNEENQSEKTGELTKKAELAPSQKITENNI